MKKLLCLISMALLLAACSSDSTETAAQPASVPAKPVEETVQKVADAAQPPSTPSFDNGSAIYQQSCRNCHESGLMGAPKLGNDRYRTDIDVLVENSIKGIGKMPARGGNSSLSDADVRAAVMYMVEQSK